MTDRERKEALIRATFSGLGFELVFDMGSYTVIDRRSAFGLPSAIQPVICQSLKEVVALFHLR